MNVSVKSLFGKLNATCRRALEGASGLCLARTNYDVALEHWFLKLNELTKTDFAHLLRYYEIDQDEVITGSHQRY